MLNGFYQRFFRREADDGGMDPWVNLLGQGIDSPQVLTALLASDEFANVSGT